MFEKLFYLGTTDSATPYSNVMNWLHQEVFFYLVLICVFVLVLMVELISDFWFRFRFPFKIDDVLNRITVLNGVSYTHSSVLEVVWTMFPSLILFAIAFPSLDMLYILDQVAAWGLCLKVTGHQWYWSYEVIGELSLPQRVLDKI